MSKGIPDDMQQSIAQFYTHAEGIVNSFAGQLEMSLYQTLFIRMARASGAYFKVVHFGSLTSLI
jgi:hypothetical protein